MIYITSHIVNADTKELAKNFKIILIDLTKDQLEKRSKQGDCASSSILYRSAPKHLKDEYGKRMFFQSKAMYDRRKNYDIFSICIPDHIDMINKKEYRKYIKSCLRRGATYNLLLPCSNRKIVSEKDDMTIQYFNYCTTQMVRDKFGGTSLP